MQSDTAIYLHVRPNKPSDVQNVVNVHLIAFQGFFLSFLGPRFLYELYQAIQSDKNGIFYVCEEMDRIVGFVAGTTQPSGFYRHLLKKNWWRFFLASIIPVLHKPSIIPRLLRALNMPQEAATMEGCGTLMSIAVLPQKQGYGIGKFLVKEFLAEAARRNLKYINLTTDSDNNDSANRFYQDLGFSRIRSFTTPEGRRMNEYIIQLFPS